TGNYCSRPWDSVTAATDEKALEMIHKEQDKLIKLLQNDADKVLDELLCQSVITQQDYDQLNKGKDAENKIRILLVVIQRKGRLTCKQFLECLQSLFPDFQQHIQYSVQGKWVAIFLQRENGTPHGAGPRPLSSASHQSQPSLHPAHAWGQLEPLCCSPAWGQPEAPLYFAHGLLKAPLYPCMWGQPTIPCCPPVRGWPGMSHTPEPSFPCRAGIEICPLTPTHSSTPHKGSHPTLLAKLCTCPV
uniref:CARD domain-containing protein n=1 Tax=Chelydra serpentina TaxID=8475 RepID=A0A8C3SST7_CHESE